jgi:hypothetical protein|tara:strand:+ start:3094 stop:3435 length:342 start_codon:yes stop_codon:yes gene_type:complete
MSKLLQTQLPLAQAEVTSDTFNRLIRILEINLGAVDLDNTRQVSENELNTINFNAGSIIWNTTLEVLQVYTGNEWVDIGTRLVDDGLQATSAVGKVTVRNNGATSIKLANFGK